MEFRTTGFGVGGIKGRGYVWDSFGFPMLEVHQTMK